MKILQVVHGLGYVLLIIDEVDCSMNSGAEGDGGTSSRVIAQIKEFMSDTSHRGRVVVLMMTKNVEVITPEIIGHSAAELEAVLLRAMRIASEDDCVLLKEPDLFQAAKDVIPSHDTRMLEYMEMLAVFESSSKMMLPEKYREIPTEEVHKRFDILRGELGIVVRA